MKFTRTILKNGMRIIVVPMRDAQTVTTIVFVAAGSKYETKQNNGISHFLEHMCFKGTEKRSTPLLVSRAFDELGAETNAFTAEEYTGYYAKVDARHFDTTLDLIADIYLNATLPSDEIRKEKGVVIEEINLYNDQPMWHAESLITDLLYGNQPAGWEVLGTKQNIRRLSRETIEQYRRAHYVARGTTVVVAGNVGSAETVRKIKKQFKSISHGSKSGKRRVVEKQRSPRVGVRYKKTDQAHLIVGIRTVPSGHKDEWALSLLATILGGNMSSRLFTRLRDELGMCYYVSASNRYYTDHGYLAIRAGVTKKRIEEALREIVLLCRELTSETVSAVELRRAKNYTIGSMYLKLESTDVLAGSYGIQDMLGVDLMTPKERAREIRAVHAADIQRVARRIFQVKNLNAAIVGPYKGAKKFRDVLLV